MIRSPDKCYSDPNLMQSALLSENTTPTLPNFVSSRTKRKRSVEQLSDMFATLMTQHKAILASNQEIEKSISFLSSQYDDLSRKVCDIEMERKKDLEYII
ncbi:unnamed protein product [Pieris brassicae]|uniref:Uncharacterized protein n=1 Tax=Pieris brassicae TaxID=7116 RepID=A0A9P0TKF3_PIEBR|nr:unnamed protein product [Pieris brassicae]